MTDGDAFRLDGNVAIVTGASTGLGVEIAVDLAEAGADVVVAARRVELAQVTADRIAQLGRQSLAVECDISDPDQCRALADQCNERFGRLDVLVNNAGNAGEIHPASREPAEHFRSVIDTNLNGTYWMSQAAARHMTPGSSIISISSVLAVTTTDLPHAAYSASKAGLLGLTRDLARQWTRRKGIRVNAIAPGFFASQMIAEYDPGFLAPVMDRIQLDRFGDPKELAAVVRLLASPAGGYITGQLIVVDGGLSIA